MRKSITRAVGVMGGVCALAVTAAAVVPAATGATLPKYYVNQKGTLVQPGQVAQDALNCKTGDHPTGGGFRTVGASGPSVPAVEADEPFGGTTVPNPRGWNVVVLNNGTSAFTLDAFVDCVHY